MDKLTQKERLLKLFRDNGNQFTLGMVMKTDLADEWRARLTDLRNDGYEIPSPVTDKETPSNNLYTLIERDSPISPISPSKPKDTSKYVNSFVTTYILLHSCFKCACYYRAAEKGKKCKIC